MMEGGIQNTKNKQTIWKKKKKETKQICEHHVYSARCNNKITSYKRIFKKRNIFRHILFYLNNLANVFELYNQCTAIPCQNKLLI